MRHFAFAYLLPLIPLGLMVFWATQDKLDSMLRQKERQARDSQMAAITNAMANMTRHAIPKPPQPTLADLKGLARMRDPKERLDAIRVAKKMQTGPSPASGLISASMANIQGLYSDKMEQAMRIRSIPSLP